jgi:hypothetical protein
VSDVEEVKALLARMSEVQQRQVFAYLRSILPKHPVEDRLMISAEGMLDALDRAGDFTVRMIRGVFAEAAFATDVLPLLTGWRLLPTSGDPPYDFLMTDQPEGTTPPASLLYPKVRVQVKMQRSVKKKEKGSEGAKKSRPLFANEQWSTLVSWPADHYVVELQKSRKGEKGGQSTRPYRFKEFDIVAVSLGPARGKWSAFMYTVERWLLHDPAHPDHILTFQPVAPTDNDCWTSDFNTAVRWLRSGENRKINGDLPGVPAKGGRGRRRGKTE